MWNFNKCPIIEKGFPGSSAIKNLPAIAGDARDTGSISRRRRSPAEGNLEKKMSTHSSILAWKIPRTEEPGGL